MAPIKSSFSRATSTEYAVPVTQTAYSAEEIAKTNCQQKSSGVLICIDDRFHTISQEQFESIDETASVLKDEKMMVAINEDKDGKQKTISLAEVRKKLGL